MQHSIYAVYCNVPNTNHNILTALPVPQHHHYRINTTSTTMPSPQHSHNQNNTVATTPHHNTTVRYHNHTIPLPQHHRHNITNQHTRTSAIPLIIYCNNTTTTTVPLQYLISLYPGKQPQYQKRVSKYCCGVVVLTVSLSEVFKSG